MNVIIIEDEKRAANLLERLILDIDASISVVAKLETIKDSIAFLTENKDITLIFSDIELSDGLSFQIFKSVDISCPIVFTTAFDQYAIEAFKTNGIDYLLKPIEKRDLKKALMKYNRFFQSGFKYDLNALTSILKDQNKHYKTRFMVRVGEKIKTIQVEDIQAFYSMQRATFLLTKNHRHFALDMSLDQIQSVLEPEQFFRINRRYIVAFRHVSEIVTWSSSRIKVIIPGLDEEPLVVARERTRDFKNWLGD